MGLVVYYTLIGRPFYGAGGGGDGQLFHGELFARARGIADPYLQSGIYGASRAIGAVEFPGGVFQRMAPVLWVIASVSTLTVIHRVVYTWQELRAGRTLPEVGTSSLL